MAGQAKIVSFDRAKSAAGAPRPSAASKARPSRPSAKAAKPAQSSKRAKPAQPPKRATAGKISKPAQSQLPRPAAKAKRPPSKAARKAPLPAKGAAQLCKAAERDRRLGAAIDGRARDTEEARLSKRERLKRARAKSKAGKRFTKQFGGSGASDASAQGPRAALYKGEMGRRHKQAARMQNSPGTGYAAKRFSPGLSMRIRSPRLMVGMLVAAGLVLSCMFLYPTAKQYYAALRQHDQLEAEYTALQARNSAIQSEIDLLSTEAGIEDRAREEFGWVKEGENTATVYGLEREEPGPAYAKNIPAGSIEAAQTWYSPWLDALFGLG